MLTEMEQQLQAIVTVLSLVNPLICGVMFAQIEVGQTRAIRITDATKAALAVLVILLVAALAGARVLQIFGISLDAFSIAGGGVLTWIGFSMLRGNTPQDQRPFEGWRCRETVTHAVDLVRGEPGYDYRSHHARCCACETGAADHRTRRGRSSHGIMWAVMVLLARGGPHASGGGSLLHDMVTRFMGLIVLAMGVQFALTGLRNFFS